MRVTYVQGCLWDDVPAAPPGRAAAPKQPTRPGPPPAVEPPARPASPADDATATSAPPRSAPSKSALAGARREPAVVARPDAPPSVVRPAPKATPGPRSSEPAGAQARPTAGEAVDDEGMEQAAEWVEQLLEEAAGGAAAVLRSFVRAFPPAARWGQPWPAGTAQEELPAFAPAAASYAAALREVAAGRRRVRIDGRWTGGGRGSVVAGARTTPGDETPAWSILAAGP